MGTAIVTNGYGWNPQTNDSWVKLNATIAANRVVAIDYTSDLGQGNRPRLAKLPVVGDQPGGLFGVLKDGGVAGDEPAARFEGLMNVELGATLAAGAYAMAGTAGTLVAATAGNMRIARVIVGGASGDVVLCEFIGTKAGFGIEPV